MGTLFEQRPRAETLTIYVNNVIGTAEQMGIDPDTATPDQWRAAAAVATAALAIQSADAFDEQLAGFGEIAARVVTSVEELLILLQRSE